MVGVLTAGKAAAVRNRTRQGMEKVASARVPLVRRRLVFLFYVQQCLIPLLVPTNSMMFVVVAVLPPLLLLLLLLLRLHC